MNEQTRDSIRHATYEHVRNDLRGSQTSKTKKKVTCTPPNVQCGGRCIPPNWDCRLKGEGQNAELKVHAQDVSAGLASIQRGGVDVAKGVVGLNPARFERGRRSLIRGSVKLAPGDNLEEKKALRRKLEKNTALIAGVTSLGIAITVGYGGGRKFVPASVRSKWETPAKNAFNSVLDSAPFLGARRARNRQAGEMAATTLGGVITRGVRQQGVAATAAGNSNGIGPLSFRSRSANTEGSGLTRALDTVNGSGRSFDSWKQEATQVLFGAKTPKGHSVYSERATNELFTTQFGLSKAAVTRGVGGAGDTQSVRNASVISDVGNKLSVMGKDMTRDMKTRGIVSQDTYIKTVALPNVGKGLKGLSALQRKAALGEAETTIRAAMGGIKTSKDRAKALHTASVDKYDTYFNGISSNMQRFAGNPVNRDSPLGDGATALARFEIGRKTGSSPQILSRGHGDLLLREHYQTRVAKSKTGYIVGEATAKRVAQTITRSTTVPTSEQAFKILNTNGFPNAVSGVRRPSSTTTPRTPKTGLGAQRALGSLAKAIQQRKGNENMSMEAALRAARAEQKRRDSARGDDEHMSPTITKRNPPSPLVTNNEPAVVSAGGGVEHLPADEDEMVTPLMPVSKMSQSPSPKEAEEQSEEPTKPTGTVKISLNLEIPASAIKTDAMPPRVAAYLQTREDLRGKSCGGSYIPKAHNCTKSQGKEAAPESGTKSGGISGKKIAAAVLVGSVGAVAVAAASDAYQLNSGLGMPDTPSLRTAIKPHLNGGKGSDPVVMQAAMGRYYDKQVKEQGWKVGDLIYSKTKNEPVSHFAIYMGKNKEGAHSFAMMGVDGLNGKQGGIDVLEAGAGAKRKTGLLYAKAPSNKQPKVKYSPEEIASRVSRLQGKKLDYDTFNANCESWANMIVSGKSRSLQSQRLTAVGKTAIRGVYKSLESVAALDEDYPKQVRSGERIQKVARWLDNTNPRGNDLGYQAMVQRNSKYRKDAANSETLGLIDPSTVIKEHMSDIEAVSATKRWLMVLTAVSADGPN